MPAVSLLDVIALPRPVRSSALGFAAVALSFVAPLRAQTVVNGDFEDITGMINTTAVVKTGVPSGWSFGSSVQTLGYSFSGSPTGGQGQWYLEGHTELQLGTLSQAITGFSVGSVYQLDFLWGNRIDEPHPTFDLYNFEVRIAGEVFAASGAGLVDMSSESLSFVATADTHLLEIEFLDPGGQTHTNGAFDQFTLTESCDGVATSETPRAGTPANPAAFLPGQTAGPMIGGVWDPVIDHATFAPGAIADFLIATSDPINVALGAPGTLLCDLGTLILTQSSFSPGEPFVLPIPFNCALAGISVCAQGASVDVQGVRLTNALDVVIGTF